MKNSVQTVVVSRCVPAFFILQCSAEKTKQNKENTRRTASACHDAPRQNWNKVGQKYWKGILEVTEYSIFISVHMSVWRSPHVRQKKTHMLTLTHAHTKKTNNNQKKKKNTQARWLTIFGFWISALVSSSKCFFLVFFFLAYLLI